MNTAALRAIYKALQEELDWTWPADPAEPAVPSGGRVVMEMAGRVEQALKRQGLLK